MAAIAGGGGGGDGGEGGGGGGGDGGGDGGDGLQKQATNKNEIHQTGSLVTFCVVFSLVMGVIESF